MKPITTPSVTFKDMYNRLVILFNVIHRKIEILRINWLLSMVKYSYCLSHPFHATTHNQFRTQNFGNIWRIDAVKMELLALLRRERRMVIINYTYSSSASLKYMWFFAAWCLRLAKLGSVCWSISFGQPLNWCYPVSQASKYRDSKKRRNESTFSLF